MKTGKQKEASPRKTYKLILNLLRVFSHQGIKIATPENAAAYPYRKQNPEQWKKAHSYRFLCENKICRCSWIVGDTFLDK